MVPKKILVIGGYGTVGKVISKTLAQDFPGQVIAAGRNIQRAEKLSQETRGEVLPMVLDILNFDSVVESNLEDVSQVVMCLDQTNPRFAKICFQRGIDYIDITANTSFFLSVEEIGHLAKENGSCGVLSVGLVPGLTNLLAAQAGATLDEINHLDIFVMLGMGDNHGDAAIQWMLENLDLEFTVLENGVAIVVRSFEGSKRTRLPGIGERTAYRFNFPDQHTIPRTLGINSVSSRLCFDIEIVTNVIAILKRTGFFRILNNEWFKELFTQILKNLSFGSDQFVLRVEATGSKNNDETKFNSTIRGANEARMTGLVAAQVARQIYTGTFPSGIFHIDQLFELQPLLIPMIENGSFEITHETL